MASKNFNKGLEKSGCSVSASDTGHKPSIGRRPMILREDLANDVTLKGEIDTTFQTQQRDMFTSGLAAAIGVNAFAVWHAIKSHANYETGKCWPGIRRLMELTGIASASVQGAIKSLEQAHLLRVTRLGKKNIYVARERMDVRVGKRVICTVVVDYVPNSMRERMAKLKDAALTGDMESEDVWADVDVIPGPGMVYDKGTGTFKGLMRADEVPQAVLDGQRSVALEREKLRKLADETRKKPLPKK